MVTLGIKFTFANNALLSAYAVSVSTEMTITGEDGFLSIRPGFVA